MRTRGRLWLLVVAICYALAVEPASAQARAPKVSAQFAVAAATGTSFPVDAVQHAQLRTATAYERIAVAQPANDATVFDNAGDVEVRVDVSPALRVRAGDRIALILDGKKASVSAATRIKLSGVARGEHTLEAQALDSSGSVVISSAPVKFHLWQASRLFPGRREK